MADVHGDRGDPADSVLPGFAEIRFARALQGRGRWARAVAGLWLLGLLTLIGATVVNLLR